MKTTQVAGVLLNSESSACTYGSFKLRLNSSPGVKKVRRQYVGETTVTHTEEAVYIVVTPDETPQTAFYPSSVTFTHAGGVVNGVDTYRWDEPVKVEVRPVDDDVDERAGVTIDFTAFSIQVSHASDVYWNYATKYMTTSPAADTMHAFGVSGGRTKTHTPFRHTIRTVHSMDNDYAGVSLNTLDGVNNVGMQSPDTNRNMNNYSNKNNTSNMSIN